MVPLGTGTCIATEKWIQRQTLNYLKKVLRSEESMSKIGPEGVLTIFDRVSRASTSIANSRGSSDTTIEVISNIPLSESEKNAAGESEKRGYRRLQSPFRNIVSS